MEIGLVVGVRTVTPLWLKAGNEKCFDGGREMSDIIKDAKQLLEGATPGPWVINGEFDPECPELQGAPQLENGLLQVPIISHNIYGDFFPEDGDLIAKSWTNAKALAEETYEYSFQVQNTIDMWEHPRCAGEPDRWWDTESEAEVAALAAHEYGYPIRIVRRRVSPPEVINE